LPPEPLGRIADPIDVALVAPLLASAEAKLLSGAGIAIDGAAGVNFWYAAARPSCA